MAIVTSHVPGLPLITAGRKRVSTFFQFYLSDPFCYQRQARHAWRHDGHELLLHAVWWSVSWASVSELLLLGRHSLDLRRKMDIKIFPECPFKHGTKVDTGFQARHDAIGNMPVFAWLDSMYMSHDGRVNIGKRTSSKERQAFTDLQISHSTWLVLLVGVTMQQPWLYHVTNAGSARE